MSGGMTAARVQDVYGHGARQYENVMLRYWEFDRQALVDSLELVGGERVLEVGVGTGKNLVCYPPDVAVTGIDFTPQMLDVARDRLMELARTNIALKEMDAEEMAFEEDRFDAALESFALCVAPRPERVLQEIARVTKPGARIAVFDYCRSGNPGTVKWQELIAETARTIGFPPGVIVWDPLRDYEEIIEQHGIPLLVRRMTRHENANPFLLACDMLLVNDKGKPPSA